MTAEMMYDAVTGTASPRIQTASADEHDRQRQRPAGQADDEAGGLEAEAGQRHDADDDAGDGGGREHGQHVLAAADERVDQPPRRQPRTRAASRKLSTTAATVAQNTARNGEKPDAIRTATRTSEVKCRYWSRCRGPGSGFARRFGPGADLRNRSLEPGTRNLEPANRCLAFDHQQQSTSSTAPSESSP